MGRWCRKLGTFVDNSGETSKTRVERYLLACTNDVLVISSAEADRSKKDTKDRNDREHRVLAMGPGRVREVVQDSAQEGQDTQPDTEERKPEKASKKEQQFSILASCTALLVL